MAQLLHKTRADISPRGLPRVYFVCHEDDRKGYLEEIVKEIHSISSCAVYYYDGEPELDGDFYMNLSQMQLVVMPVTSRLLYQPNRAMDVEFSYAMEHHIPVLPLMQEKGLGERYKEKFGDLQFLDKYDPDPTALPYKEKLKKYLEAVLVGDELAAKVRAAFDAYIFLSYRKKDRKFAQELMRLIHRSPLCRDIAIWYDEFLTPGENFNDSIKEALEKSGLFVLAVTPNLVNEINYVMTTEYPMAKDASKPILPVEMQPTALEALRESYAGIPDTVDPEDQERFTRLLLEALRNLMVRENDNDPMHNFFIGLAYLSGIDVEIDHDYAVKLITAAAEAGITEAMEKLVSMYENGEGVKRDHRRAVQWRKELAETAEFQYILNGTEDSAGTCFLRLLEWGDGLYDLRELEQAKAVYERLYVLAVEKDERWKSDDSQRDLSIAYEKMGRISLAMGDADGAKTWFSSAMEISRCLALRSGGADRDLAVAYNTMGDVCRRQGKRDEAKKWYQKDMRICAERMKTGSVSALRDMEICCNKLGDLSMEEGDLVKAKEFYVEGLKISERLAALGDHVYRRDLAVCCNRLGDVLFALREQAQAKAWYTRALHISQSLAESGTIESMRDLASSYERMGKICYAYRLFAQAKQWYIKAMEISRQTAETGSLDTQRDLAVGYADLGRACAALGEIGEARRWTLSAVELRERMAESSLPEALRDLGISYYMMGELGRAQRSLEEAKKWYLKCADVRQKLVGKASTADALRGLAAVSGRLGELYHALKDLFEARIWYSAEQRILLRLSRYQDVRDALMKNYDAMAMIFLDQNKPAEAVNALSKGLDLARQLAREKCDTVSRENLALFCYKLGRMTGSRRMMEEALALFETLSRENPGLTRYAQRIQGIRVALNRLI